MGSEKTPREIVEVLGFEEILADKQEVERVSEQLPEDVKLPPVHPKQPRRAPRNEFFIIGYTCAFLGDGTKWMAKATMDLSPFGFTDITKPMKEMATLLCKELKKKRNH